MSSRSKTTAEPAAARAIPDPKTGSASASQEDEGSPLGLRTEYWVFESGALVRADGRPVILKNRKTAESFIEEMGMSKNWEIEERVAPARQTRGRKAKDSSELRRAAWTWAMMKPEKRPAHYGDQRAFMEKYCGPLSGNPKQKQRAVRAFIKQIQRLHQKAQENLPLITIDEPLP